MLLLFLSFNYTPPPDWVLKNGQTATIILFAFIIFMRNVKWGVFIGGLGSFIITFWETSFAKGDLGGLSHFIDPPIQAVIGAIIGAIISFMSKSIWKFFRKRRNPSIELSDEPQQNSQPG
jgi:hypothetical protein